MNSGNMDITIFLKIFDFFESKFQISLKFKEISKLFAYVLFFVSRKIE